MRTDCKHIESVMSDSGAALYRYSLLCFDLPQLLDGDQSSKRERMCAYLYANEPEYTSK